MRRQRDPDARDHRHQPWPCRRPWHVVARRPKLPLRAAGNALTAAAMGLLGTYLSNHAIFLAAAALCLTALIALQRIKSDEIDYIRARNARDSSCWRSRRSMASPEPSSRC
jgi:hypothetical protein